MSSELTIGLVAGTSAVLGSVMPSIISAIHDKWKTKYNRHNQEEDKKEKYDKDIQEIKEQLKSIIENQKKQEEKQREQDIAISNIRDSLCIFFLDILLWTGERYIAEGEISMSDKMAYHKMYDAYHNKLNGNGDARMIFEMVEQLPPKKEDDIIVEVK